MNLLKAALIFQDYCVIQRRKPIRIWGTAAAQHQITVVLGQQSACGSADSSGNWEVWFSPMEACGDTSLEILDHTSMERIICSHVAIGEVWIAGGQSNMEFLMKYDDDRYMELDREENVRIRYFEVPHLAFDNDPMDVSDSGLWRLCDRENLEFFSAVGYYFARDLEKSLNVPVGIVACNWGGTSALTWIAKEQIQSEPLLKPFWNDYQESVSGLDMEAYESLFLQTRSKMNRLAKASHQQIRYGLSREDQLQFVRDNELEKYGLVPSLPMGPWHQNCPGRLYESMLLKIAGMSTRGVIWYQGESDVDRKEVYDVLFLAVISSWRKLWREELPWLFVQLAPFYKWLDQDGTGFPLIRQKQEQITRTVPQAWMVSIMDCGMKWGIHPTRKKDVGRRLSLLARGKVYGEAVLCENPECVSARQNENQIVLTFEHAGEGMELHDEIQNDLYVICGDQKIERKEVECNGDHVIIRLERDMVPVSYVEYLNVPYGEAMLYNSAGLPAKPFVIQVDFA